MPALPASCDVVVLGAGPAGLASAWYAARRGFSVVVIDHAPEAGGLAGGMVIDGQSVDFGSHRLHPSIRSDILEDLRDDLGVELQWRPRNGRIRLRGRWLEFPLRPLDLARHAPPSFSGRVIADAAVAPIRRLLADRSGAPTTFGDAVRRGLGPTVAHSFYEPYARKLWAVDSDQLSAELFRRRVSAGSSAAIVRRMMRRGEPPGFWYPSRGFATICAALADGVRDRGGVVALSTRVGSVSAAGDDVLVDLDRAGQLTARTLISTIPAAGLVAALRAPQRVHDAADRLEFRGAALVYLTVPRPEYTAFDAHYFPETTTIISRLSEPKNYRASKLDPSDRSVLCVEIPTTPGDTIWNSDDRALVERVRRELIGIGLPDPEPVSSEVVRRTHVYPVYRIGFEVHEREVDEHLDAIPNLAVVGRQATFAHDNTHHALLMAKTVAAMLTDDARVDRARWQDARRAFSDHVVED